MWYGDLVTMAWWEGAWLNEAFASFMELKATDTMHPEWKRWLTFANLEVPWAMATDQLASTRPIEFEVNAPSEVDEMFDAITYGKGNAVLRMLEMFIGTEAFREGVGSYLRKHSYANTVTADLWEGLDGASEWQMYYKITLPLIRPAFLAGLIYTFARSMTAISAVIFLTTPKVRIMTAQILNETEGARYGNAFAYSVLLILIVLAAIAILSLLVGTRTGAEQTTETGGATWRG